ncbi:polysaccharide lyase 6 family protein [Kutzneria sp. CA-103260]|uniref:polysaccharide lyase 6 family protein n=1 Tax=Kutzneria sp. CA-103260 TaxID=2802641 RepID=UPI001BABFA66|nr:polysaccharide lyase 6 family protein [Kutzneria sp. CA-103260]QUQ63666.1 lyase precursor [Kutzneria sp. CA-103260]
MRLAHALIVTGLTGALALPGVPADSATPRTFMASPSQLSAVLSQARPGDHVEVTSGVYTTGLIHVGRSGTAAAPITISASGPVTFTGAGGLDLAGASHVVVQGFTFSDGGGLTVPGDAKANRVTRNTFQGNTGGADLTVKADDTEVDHNTFENRTAQGNYIQVVGPGASDMAKRVHIHQNYFYNHQYKGANGGESIRFGLSGRQHAVADGLIENNLFDKADGDSEAISIKSSNNVVRYNTIINSRGTLSLRHGWNTRVEGNILIGGSTGIRFFGNNHVIVNNLVEDTSGPAMEFGGGEVRDDTTSGTDHEASDHCIVAFNTLSGSDNLVWYESSKKYPPSDDTLADNVLLGHGTAAGTGTGTTLHFTGNILSGSSAGSLPAGSYRTIDPKLTRDAHNLLRPTAGSPVIGAATGSFPQVTLDIDQQSRPSAKDVGADQFNSATPAHPLTPAEVGPKAP